MKIDIQATGGRDVAERFDGPMLGHKPGMPVHYDLHVWLYEENPRGLFAPFDPSVTC